METICWYCGCSGRGEFCWDRRFEPVPGWAAIPSTIRSSREGVEEQSYIVLDCPAYRAPDYMAAAGRTRPPGQMEMTYWTYSGMTREQISQFCRSIREGDIETEKEK